MYIVITITLAYRARFDFKLIINHNEESSSLIAYQYSSAYVINVASLKLIYC